MRNLIAFFKRFRIFLYFALLQGIALSTYFTYLSFPRSQYLTTASAVSGQLLTYRNDVTKHFQLPYNNRKLQYENIQLRHRLPESFIKVQGAIFKIDDTLQRQQYEYIPAVVINSTVNKRNNYFTLSSGKSSGIYRGMGVFSNKGIVGIIHNVSDHYAVVKSVLTEDINIDVMVEKNGVFGLLKWNGKNPKIGSISSISNDLTLKKWSKIVTRGGSGIFPRGLPVGKIKSLKTVEGKPLWDVEIYYSEDYRKIQNVYVIKNLLLKEQKELEKKIPSDEEIE
ncbi:MAG: rod shape-determining protein MreC [Crocinitomicaceae bacterium]|jgi:rod shape-determining protein MreC